MASSPAHVIDIAKYRSACRAPLSHAAHLSIASTLATSGSILYVGIDRDGLMNFGLSGVEHDEAVSMIEAAGYLIGELSKIVAGV
jgi:hypothetical protein